MNSLSTRTLSEKLNCCVCSSVGKTSAPWKMIESWQLMKCGQCGLVHLDTPDAPAENFLEEAPSKVGLEYWGYPEVFRKHASVFRYYFIERFRRIKEFSPPEGLWLDVGTGFGLWQSYLNEQGIHSAGIEIEKGAVEYCLTQGLSVQHASIEDWKTDKKFAVITMCDVLEHVSDPESVLKKCHDLLLPGGVLYLQVPNVLGLVYPYKDSLGLPHHLWQFNPGTLNKLVQKCDFKIKDYWTGVQGVIRHYEQGGPTLVTKALWKLAMSLKRGNRLQLLAVKS